MSAKRVVVIGGGLAGVTAALDLADSGATVTLLESRGRLGGAAYSFERDGLTVDNGQHVFLRCCDAYRALLTRMGAESLVTLEPLAIPVLAPGGRRAMLSRNRLPAPLHLAPSLLRYPFLTLAQRLSVAVTMQALARVNADDPTADARSFGDWLAAHRQHAAAIETVWELIARPTLNLSAADASLAQAAYVFQQGLLSDPDAGDVGYARVPLGEIHDTAARRALERARVAVHLRAGANSVRHDGLQFLIEVSAQPTVSADAVVLSTGPERTARLLPDGSGVEAAQLRQLGSSPIVNLHMGFDRQVLDVPFAASVHSPLQWIFDRTASSGLDHGQYLAVSLSAADRELDMTAEQLKAEFLPALTELLPGASAAALSFFFVTREHAATFRAAPGSRALRPGPRTAVPGLALAGTWTDTGWPATMEGAVRSGHAAAEATAEFLDGRVATEAVLVA